MGAKKVQRRIQIGDADHGMKIFHVSPHKTEELC